MDVMEHRSYGWLCEKISINIRISSIIIDQYKNGCLLEKLGVNFREVDHPPSPPQLFAVKSTLYAHSITN